METGYKVCDAMTMNPVTISKDVSLEECAKIMEKEHVGALIIKDKKNPVGIITEQDIVRKAVINNDMPSSKKASDIMTGIAYKISPEQDIYHALVVMRDANIRHLPVVTEKGMIGLLTLKDVLKIEPQLFDLLVDKFEVKEHERKLTEIEKDDGEETQKCDV